MVSSSFLLVAANAGVNARTGQFIHQCVEHKDQDDQYQVNAAGECVQAHFIKIAQHGRDDLALSAKQHEQCQFTQTRHKRQQKAAYENQQRTIEKTEEFIERFRYKPTKSNQVQSRIKQLEKMERIELEVEDKTALSVKFPPAPRSGDVAFEVKDAVIGYPADDVRSAALVSVSLAEKSSLGKTPSAAVLSPSSFSATFEDGTSIFVSPSSN